MSADLPRLLSNLIRTGTIAEVDPAQQRVRVSTGELTTDWAPWFARRAGSTLTWSAPSVGEQVLVLCPEGDPANAVVLCGLYSDQVAPPSSDPAVDVVQYADGAQVAYNAQSHVLSAVLPAGATVQITADGGTTINGPLTVNGATKIVGDTEITGKATASVDVVGAGISLKNHKHSGVQSGSALTGAPQ